MATDHSESAVALCDPPAIAAGEDQAIVAGDDQPFASAGADAGRTTVTIEVTTRGGTRLLALLDLDGG